MESTFDVLIIGGGQAGIPLARSLAAAGKRVALAERKDLGGSCVNFGCTPSKAAIASARVAHMARRAGEYGVKVSDVQVDFPKVLQRARDIALASRESLAEIFLDTDNPKLIRAHARFLGRSGSHFRLEAGGQEILAKEVVLDTGTRSILPPIDHLDEIDFLNSENWLEHTQLPAHLVVIGGGYIGLEMGQFYRRMGSQVTIVQQDGQIAGHEDKDVADNLQAILEGEGISFLLWTRVTSIEQTGSELRLTIKSAEEQEVEKQAATKQAGDKQAAEEQEHAQIRASHVFVAVGREPNTDDLGLETIGLARGEKGVIEVDQHLHTKVEGVWAVGDIRGGPMFTHTSWDDYRIVESQMLGNGSRSVDRVVPYAIFTEPQLGRVGMTESDAKRQGRNIKVGRFDMKGSGKAKELGETQGFIKVVVDADSRKILGAAVLSEDAAELVHLYVELMNADAPYTVMERAIHIHPTLAEAVQSALSTL